jgi:hypothetical protein
MPHRRAAAHFPSTEYAAMSAAHHQRARPPAITTPTIAADAIAALRDGWRFRFIFSMIGSRLKAYFDVFEAPPHV